MRIACLQFAPQVADVDNNLNRADAVLNDVAPEDLDLLVLPELAFSGYNFKSLGHITPFLEITNSGISSLWARTTALKHDCTVVVGYPEKVDPTLNWPTDPEYYNSAIVVNGDGETVANYRKSHLYYTDETWALEGSHGFFQGRLSGLGRTALGICMDLNPYKFQAPWDRFEFAQHALDSGARLVIVSMAWITNDDPQTFNNIPQEPDSDTILYWVSRLEPIIRIESNEEVFVVFANRCGTEGSATYAGTSAVVGIRSGEVWVYGILGRGETDLLVVDTDDPPYAKLVYRPNKASVGLENPETPEAAEDAYVEATERDQSSSEDGEKPPVASPSAAVTNKADNLNLMPSLQGIKHVFGEKHSKRLENAHYENQDDEQFKRKSMASSIETDSLQPRIAIPSEQFMLQRYLESESPTTSYHTLHSKTLQSLHGSSAYREPTAVTKTPHRQTEIAKAHPSPLRTTESEQYWDSSYDIDDMIISETDSQIRSNENRYSLRSDVSVWNNQHGRPRSVAVPITASPQLPSRRARPATSAVDQSARASARTKEGSGSKNQQQMYGTYGGTPRRTADFDLPILKPASQSQLLNRRGSDAEKGVQRLPLSHSTVQAGQVRPSTVPNGPNTDRNDIGRGRRRSAQPQSRERRRRSNSGQAASTQPIDLSQFRLIEEYPSANCPVHGSRPPSGTRRRTESGARGRTDSQSRPLAENDRGRRQHSHGTQQSSSRKTQSVSKHSAQRARDVPQPNRPSSSRPAAASSRADLITETILSSSHVPLTNSGAEPRTPVAMLLIQDSLTTMENTDRVLSPLKCVERDAAHVISRPLSSIW